MKLLIYGINYAPECTGTGKYTGEAAEWLAARGHRVRVVTAPPYYPKWEIGRGYSGLWYRRERIGAVKVWRCPLWVPGRPSGLKRVLHLGSFALSSFPVMLRQIVWRPRIVLAVEPPLLGAPTAWLVARLSGASCWLHVQDFEVDAAFELNMLPRAMQRFVCGLERWLMRRFDRVSTISARMMERLEAKGVSASAGVFFPNWVDTDVIFPLDRASRYRAELGIGERCLVALYSGNMGEKQGLEILVEAARRLNGDDRIEFVLCGDGAMRRRLEALAYGLSNVRWLPLQPMERLNELLNLADIHLLPQRADAADLVMPSKLTGMLASGRPVVATANEGTEVAGVVSQAGVVVPPGDVDLLVEAIRLLAAQPEQRAALGAGGRRYAERKLAKEAVLARFEEELVSAVEARSQ